MDILEKSMNRCANIIPYNKVSSIGIKSGIVWVYMEHQDDYFKFKFEDVDEWLVGYYAYLKNIQQERNIIEIITENKS